ncbi:MAG TPA: class I SAM-dependent methyltransferase [Bacteroidota bacterium]|nr:class I SAM-dependent methyltransferase [Bacteroidota bacterium]
MNEESYDELIAREAAHWGAVGAGERDPQIWDDERMFALFFGDRYEQFLRTALSAGPRILELGCGGGGTALALAARGARVTGIDLSAARIEGAVAEATRRGLGAEFVVGDLNRMPLPGKPYDAVVAHDALHHILELGGLLDRVREALVPGGRLVVMDFAGMGRIRKLAAAGLFAVLPTHRPYREKWMLRRRLASFLAPEARKRESLARGTAEGLHDSSPFEEISGPSIHREIASRFTVEEYATFCPFWYYLAPKLSLPAPLRMPVARTLRAMDAAMTLVRPHSGAYILITART